MKRKQQERPSTNVTPPVGITRGELRVCEREGITSPSNAADLVVAWRKVANNISLRDFVRQGLAMEDPTPSPAERAKLRVENAFRDTIGRRTAPGSSSRKEAVAKLSHDAYGQLLARLGLSRPAS